MKETVRYPRISHAMSGMAKGILEGMIYATAISVFLSVFFLFAPILENSFFPVLKNFKVINTSTHDNYRMYNFDFEKIRDCDVDRYSVAWFKINSDGTQEEILLEIPPIVGDPTRPKGFHVSKDWKVFLNKDEKYLSQKIIMYHKCHPGWRTRTEILFK